MKNMKNNIPFCIVLVCVLLFAACNNSEPPEPDAPMSCYGRISISFEEAAPYMKASQAARTVFPSLVFDAYVYTFTKVGEQNGVVKTPDNSGFFTLGVGNYTVAVQAYIDDEEQYTLAASGTSSEFSVAPYNTTSVSVSLRGVVAEGEGEFSCTISHPADAVPEITLHKLPEMEKYTLNYETISEGNSVVETLQLDSGSYLLTVLVRKTGLYAGLIESVHIYPLLSTVYTKNFDDADFSPDIPVTVNDYTISGTGTFTYDGSAKTASVTRKENASAGAITVLYNGTEDEPVNAGIYTVTFNVKAIDNWGAANGFPAGTITISKATGAIVNAPSGLLSVTVNSITINPVTQPANGQTVEYARNTENTAPSTGWQDETTFSGLSEGTNYYIFARSKVNSNYNTGAASASLLVTTLQTVSQNSIVYYWVDQHNSLVATGGGATLIAAGDTLTITAQSTGYVVKQWHLNGVDTGQSGSTYTFSKTTTGKYIVGLFVEKDGKLYNTNITITVGYRVTFHANGGTGTPPPAQIAAPGSNITLPYGNGLTKTYYFFDGWNTNTAGTGNNYSAGSSYTVNGNITLYAKWTIDQYTVTFNINGGSGTTPIAQTVTRGSSINLPSDNGLTKSGYNFGGWNTSSNGTGDNYNAGSSYTVNGNITLYARWGYNVYFSNNGGNGTVPTQFANPGSSITLPSGSGLTRPGYTFGGWNINSGGTGTNYNAGSSYTVNSITTLYAKWNHDPSQNRVVTFSANGGTGTVPPAQSVIPGSVITLPNDNGLRKTGYTFGGWNTNAEGTGTNYSVGYIYTPPGSITLYAQWNGSGTVTVYYDLNGGTNTGTPLSAQAVTAGSSIILPSGSGLTKSGYAFLGWNTMANGLGNNYNAGSSFTVNGNTTLYAKWGSTSRGGEGNPIQLAAGVWSNDAITTAGGAVWYTFTIPAGVYHHTLWWNDSKDGNGTKTLDIKVGMYRDINPQPATWDSGWGGLGFSGSGGSTYKIKVEANSGGTGTFAIAYTLSDDGIRP